MIETLGPVLISGFLTVWYRPCDLTSPCPLPQALGPSTTVSGSILPPTEAGTVSSFRQKFDSELITGQVNLFWTFPRTGTPYLVTRVDIFDKETKKPLTQCTSYADEKASLPFPVGSCASFVEQEAVTYQVGVSYSRIPQAL